MTGGENLPTSVPDISVIFSHAGRMAVEMDVSVCWSYDCSATFVQTHYLTDFWTEDHNILPYVPQKMNPNEFVHLPHCHQQVKVFC